MIFPLLALLIAPALAADFYLESFTMGDRAEAIALQQAALEDGLSARVVRRWRHGVGWGYAVVIEDLPDRATADAAAEDMAARTHRGVSVYAVDPGESLPRPDDVQLPATVGELPQISEIIERAVRAQGGREGGRARLDGFDALSFRYDREVQLEQGLLRAHHDWSRFGPERRIALEVMDGPGEDLVGEAAPGGAWLEIAGTRYERDPARTAEVLDAYGPAALLAIPLDLVSTLVRLDPDRLTLTESQVDGRRRLVLSQGASDSPELELSVDGAAWTVTELIVRSDSGVLKTSFSDWREIETGLVIPFQMRTDRDGVFMDGLRVIDLELSMTADTGGEVP